MTMTGPYDFSATDDRVNEVTSISRTSPFEVIDLREVIEGVDCDRFVKPSKGEGLDNVEVRSKCRWL